MLRIGDLAKRAHVTVKTLGHYGALGLLKPLRIDRFTGYRYYNDDQLGRLRCILALKELGFTLRQVADVLDEHISPARLRAMLELKQADLYARLAADQRRLELLSDCLQQLDTAAPGQHLKLLEQMHGMTIPVANQTHKEHIMQMTLVDQPALTVVGLCYHGSNQHKEIPALWGSFLERMGEVERLNPNVSYGICSLPGGLPDGQFEYVAGVATAADAPVPQGMVQRRLPAMRCAAFPHCGALDTLGQTYQQVYEVGLPEAGLVPLTPGLDMEVYNEEWDNGSPASVLYIYVPVR